MKLIPLALHIWVYGPRAHSSNLEAVDISEILASNLLLLPPHELRATIRDTIRSNDRWAVSPEDVVRRSIRILQDKGQVDEVLYLRLSVISTVVWHSEEMICVEIPGIPGLLESTVKACKRQLCRGHQMCEKNVIDMSVLITRSVSYVG